MKIKTKLILALCTLPILLIILTITGILQISHLNKSADSLEVNYELALLAEEIHTDFKNEAIRLRNIVIFSDESAIQTEVAGLENDSDNVQYNMNLLETKAQTEVQLDLIRSLKETNNEFNMYKEEVVSLVLDNKRGEALSLIDESSATIHEQFLSNITEISKRFGSNMQTSLESMIHNSQQEVLLSVGILAVGILFIIFIFYKNIWSLSTRLNSISKVMGDVAYGREDLTTKAEVLNNNDEIDQVALSFNQMTETLQEQMDKDQTQAWMKTNIAEISTSLSGTNDLESLGRIFLSKVVPLVESSHAVFYVKSDASVEEEEHYKLIASYAFKERKHISNQIKAGEGIIGQAILEKSPIILTDVPADYVTISSGLGEATPLTLYVLPIRFEGEVNAVFEMASFKPYSETYQAFLEELIEDLGIILESVMSRIKLARMLEESQALTEEVQAQAEELQNQQEELKAANEELEEQTQSLRESEEKLQMQQEELEETNRSLEEKTNTLEEQNQEFERANMELEIARTELEVKAEELALSSKYKSEFLANMSHELRTPLNSLLILSKLLADNGNNNLSPKQVEYAKTIYSSGKDLLTLINDILDLAKIESGKTEITIGKFNITELIDIVKSKFTPVADQKQLDFHISLSEKLPKIIYTDEARLQQILNNLLSNAFKFTKKGNVTLEIGEHTIPGKGKKIMFVVKDTGVGIAKDKQKQIFEAFQQADGTTSRKFGGTGLGLSISRELATLLNGEITVDSEVGKGSTFTLTLSTNETIKAKDQSQAIVEEAAPTMERPKPRKSAEPEIIPKEQDISPIKRVLIVDDDLHQRTSLMELIGDMDIVIKAVSSGHEAIEELKVEKMDCIILDLGLSDTNGMELLEKIKENDEYSDVKVIVYTGRDLTSKEEMQLNRHAHTIIIKNEHSPERLKAELDLYLKESTSHHEVKDNNGNEPLALPSGLEGKRVLLVDDDVRNVFALTSILEQTGLDIVFAENGYESIDVLTSDSTIDLVLMDFMMPEMDGYEAMKRIRSMPEFANLPIIALTAKAMKEDREKCMEVGASDYVVKPVEPEQLISLMKVWLYQ